MFTFLKKFTFVDNNVQLNRVREVIWDELRQIWPAVFSPRGRPWQQMWLCSSDFVYFMTKECAAGSRGVRFQYFSVFLVFTCTCDEPKGFWCRGFIVPPSSVWIPATCGAFCKLQSSKVTSCFCFLAAHLKLNCTDYCMGMGLCVCVCVCESLLQRGDYSWCCVF